MFSGVNQPEKTHEIPRSIEESDQLIRTNKKPKRKFTNLIFEKPNTQDEQMLEAPILQLENPLSPRSIPIASQTHPPSFRDMLRGATRQLSVQQQLDAMDKEDEVSDDDLAPDELEPDDRCPVILLNKEEKRKMRQPWKNYLIIKMFDGNLGYMGLMRRLKKKWNIRGELDLTDIT